MYILALDLATVSGWALGCPGEIPRSGASRLKKPSDELDVLGINLLARLEDLCAFGMPNLIAYEAAINVNASWGDGRQRSAAALMTPIKLQTALEIFAAQNYVRLVQVHPQTARKHFTGTGKGLGRLETKQSVLRRCYQLGYLPPGPLPMGDSAPIYDKADALAVWDYACAHYAGHRPKELTLYA